MKRRQFEEALSDCLERMGRGEALEACVDRYPQAAAELRPLLEVAQSLLQAAASLPARPGVQEELLRQVLERWPQGTAIRRPGPRVFFALPQAWAAAVGTVLLFVLAGWGTTAAASGTVPGEPLYPVKQAREQVGLFLTTSSDAKARYHLRLAQARAEEMTAAVLRDKPQEATEELALRLEDHVRMAVRLVGYQGPYLLPPAAPPVAPEAQEPIPSPAPPAQPVLPPPQQAEGQVPTPHPGPPLTQPSPPSEAVPQAEGVKPTPRSFKTGKEKARKELRRALREELRERRGRTERLLQEAPLRDRPRLQKVLQRSQGQLEAALTTLEAEPPPESAP